MDMVFLLLALVAGIGGAGLILASTRKASREDSSELPAVLGGVLVFFAVGLAIKGLGIPSPIDGILVPPPLPK